MRRVALVFLFATHLAGASTVHDIYCFCYHQPSCACTSVMHGLNPACTHTVEVTVERDGYDGGGISVQDFLVNGVDTESDKFPCYPPGLECGSFHSCLSGFPVALAPPNNTLTMMLTTENKAAGVCEFNNIILARFFVTETCATPSPSQSPTPTPPASPTPSPSVSFSASPTCTPSPTESPSGTRTSTGSPSHSTSPSHTPSSSRTPSHTPSSSRTPSHTPSSSRTPSHTPSSSRTPSQTPSVSPSPSQTPSFNSSRTTSVSHTPTRTPTTTPTPSPSRTSTRTPTPTPTPTLTPSPSASNTASTSATLSPTATPTASVTATPSPTATPSSSASSTLSPSPTLTPPPTPTSSPTPSPSPSQPPTPTPSSSPTPTPALPPALSLTATLPPVVDESGAGFTAVLTAHSAAAALPLAVSCAVNDTSEATVNVSTVTLTALNAPIPVLVSGLPDAVPGDHVVAVEVVCVADDGSANISLAFRSHNVVRAAVVDVGVETMGGSLSRGLAPAGEFAVTLSGGQRVVVFGDTRLPPGLALPLPAEVRLGGIIAPITNVSTDGYAVSVASPTLDAVCGGDEACISDGLYVDVVIRVLPGAEAVANGSTPGSFACPPSCPGSSPASTTAVFFTRTCVGYPTDAATCLIASTADQCALGTEPDCEPCPTGGLCPGGARLWPQPGFWVADSTQRKAPTPCAFPAPQRCLGWDVAANAMACGEGYLSSPFCGACAEAFFPSPAGCEACPEGGSLPILSWMVFAVGVGATFGVVFGVVVCVQRRRGGTTTAGLFRARDFMQWALLSLQLVAQVGKQAVAPPGPLADLYQGLLLSELNAAGVAHPACTSSTFVYPLVTLFGVLVLCGAALWLHRAAKGAQLRWAIAALVALYPLTLSTVVDMLAFRVTEVTRQSPGAVVLTWNPHHEYFAGQHTLPGVAAVVVCAVYCVGFPLATFVALRRLRPEWDNGKPLAGACVGFLPFLESDFVRRAYYLKHIQFMVYAVFATMVGVFLRAGDYVTVFVVDMVVVVGFAGLLSRPSVFVPRKRWRQPVKLWSLVVVGVALVANVVSTEATDTAGGRLAADALSWVVFAAAMALFVVLLVSFITSLLEGASAEQARILSLQPTLVDNPMRAAFKPVRSRRVLHSPTTRRESAAPTSKHSV